MLTVPQNYMTCKVTRKRVLFADYVESTSVVLDHVSPGLTVAR